MFGPGHMHADVRSIRTSAPLQSMQHDLQVPDLDPALPRGLTNGLAFRSGLPLRSGHDLRAQQRQSQ
jgi:hypothetical protein